MNRYQAIIVDAALDERDVTTFRHAARFAQAADSEVVYVAHVERSFDPPAPLPGDQGVIVPVDEEIEHRLKQFVAERPTLFPANTRVEVAVRQGSAVPELMRLAAQKSADLLCIGRRPADTHDPLSAAAMRFVRKSPCSVFLIPAGAACEYRTILVAVDFSEHAREALDVAAAVATCMAGASITVQHVYSVPTGYHKTGRTYEDFAASMKQQAESQWEQFVSKVDFRDIPFTVQFDLGDNVAKSILAVADELDADLLILSSHGCTRPAAVLLGHIADALCSKATRPVLCVKRKGEVVNLLHALLQVFELE